MKVGKNLNCGGIKKKCVNEDVLSIRQHETESRKRWRASQHVALYGITAHRTRAGKRSHVSGKGIRPRVHVRVRMSKGLTPRVHVRARVRVLESDAQQTECEN